MRVFAAVIATAMIAACLGGCATRPAGSLPACDPEDVTARVDVNAPGTGAGVVAVDLSIRNDSDDWCSLDGYPTVFILDAVTNAPIGQGAVPMADRPSGSVDVAPGATAYALVETTKAMADFTGCDARPAQGMSLILPGFEADSALVLPSPVAQFCNIPELETLLVSGFALEPLTAHDSRDADG